MAEKVRMKHAFTGEEREVEMGPAVFPLMNNGWSQVHSEPRPEHAADEKE